MVFIPRIDIVKKDYHVPFTLQRHQFPVVLCYSMTINKAQGQTISKVGVLLERSCFGHGQLYVALSRVRRMDDLRVEIIPDECQGANDSGEVFAYN